MRKTILVGLIGLAGACASPATEPVGGADLDGFELRGSRIIGCCCQTPCSCRVNKKPMHCHGCDFTTAVHIDSGRFHGTDMSGMTWAVIGRGFGEDVSKNWVYVYYSDTATDEQVGAIKTMLESHLYTWKAKTKADSLADKYKGMSKAPMTNTDSADKREYNCEIDGGKTLDLRTHSIVLPGHTEPARLSGIFD